MSLTKATYSMIEGAPVNVLDYGAVGDGVANDTAAFAAARAAASGKKIYIPAGTYKINQALTGATDFILEGDGTGAGALDVSLPFTATAISAATGQNASTLELIGGNIGVSATDVRVGKFGGGYPVATGETLRFAGHYTV